MQRIAKKWKFIHRPTQKKASGLTTHPVDIIIIPRQGMHCLLAGHTEQAPFLSSLPSTSWGSKRAAQKSASLKSALLYYTIARG